MITSFNLLRVKLPLFELLQFPYQHISTFVHSNSTGIPAQCTVDSAFFSGNSLSHIFGSIILNCKTPFYKIELNFGIKT